MNMLFNDSPDQSIHLELSGLADTEKLGLALAEVLRPGDIVLLTGDLGAGKTTLTQFIGRGLAVPADCYITSPTFSLMHEYPGRMPLYHLDLYRLAGEEDIEDLGLLDFLYGDGACVIEWPDRLGSLLPEERLEIVLRNDGEESRQATLLLHGPAWRTRRAPLAELLE